MCFVKPSDVLSPPPKKVFQYAKARGLPVKLDAEQLSDRKGAVLVVRDGSLSADYLEYVADDGVRAMNDAGTLAVFLPGVFYFLLVSTNPPSARLREQAVDIALASDSNSSRAFAVDTKNGVSLVPDDAGGNSRGSDAGGG